MSKSIEQIAEQLCTHQHVKKRTTQKTGAMHSVPNVQMIYAFNGTGKTRLSRALKKLITPQGEGLKNEVPRVMYYL